MFYVRPYKWMSGSFLRQPGTISLVIKHALTRWYTSFFEFYLYRVLMNTVCCQVLMWWGDSPCLRVLMSRRSATLEDPSSSAWARLHSYAPPSKFTVFLHLGLLQAPTDMHSMYSYRRQRMCHRKWNKMNCIRFSAICRPVDKLFIFMLSLNKEKSRETEHPTANQPVNPLFSMSALSNGCCIISRYLANHTLWVNVWLLFQKYHLISLTIDTGL